MSQDTVFREVDEELRRDRMRALWRRFGPYVIGGAVAVVLIVALNEGWSWWQNSNAARSSDELYRALELSAAGDDVGAEAALDELAARGAGNYPTLARFRLAALLAKGGRTADAIAAYDALANSESNPRLRELALVLSANLLVDAGDLAAVQSRVGTLATPENPLRNAAREAIGLAQYKAGDLNGALATFNAIVDDPLATSDLRQRVQVFALQLVSEGARTPEQLAGAPAAAPPADAAAPAPAATVDAPPESAPATSAADQPAAPDTGAATPAAPAAPAQ